MNRLTRQQELAIISAWLLGDARDKIASDLGISGSSVSAVTSQLSSDLLELRELHQNFRKLGVSSLTLKMLFKEVLENVGEEMSIEDLPSLVAHAIRAAKDEGHNVKAIVSADQRLSQLEKIAGKPYPKIISEYKEKTTLLEQLNDEITIETEKKQKIKEKTADAERKNRLTLKKSRLTKKDVAAFNATKRNLSDFGYDFQDVKTLSEHISFLKNSKCTPQQFGSMVEKYSSINEAVSSVNRACQESQFRLKAAKEVTQLTHQAANREQKRLQENKGEAEHWQSRTCYFKQQTMIWQNYLNKISWAAQQQQLYHNAIIEQNIKNQKMNPETAAEYRNLKKMDLIHQTLNEYTEAFLSITKRKIKDYLFKITTQTNLKQTNQRWNNYTEQI